MKNNLYDILRSSERIKKLVKCDQFAQELYAALCNTEWRFPDGDDMGVSWRSAGGIVADLREMNEDYLDFYCSGGEGNISFAIKEEMSLLGLSGKEFFC